MFFTSRVKAINAFDLVDMIYHTGRGIDGFMNTCVYRKPHPHLIG
jgi:hypothetical protein